MNTCYDGCNNDIANSLKKGNHIRCILFDMNKVEHKGTVVAYVYGRDYPYVTANRSFVCANPIIIIKEVIEIADMVERFEERGFVINPAGKWVSDDELFGSDILYRCGKPYIEKYHLPDWMIEENEVTNE